MPMQQNHIPQAMFVQQSEGVQTCPGSQPQGIGDTPGLVSILIPCCGQLEYTRLCIPRLLRYSRLPFELILINVGSLDGTADFLEGVAAAAPVRVRVVHANSESSFMYACREGLSEAGGEFIVWLNNDTLVTEWWLQQLIALASSNPAIGMVGPMSNCAPGKQRVDHIPYRIGSRIAFQSTADLETDRDILGLVALDRFARTWRESHKGEWFEAERLGGFCFLVKQEVLQNIEFFDDKAPLGVFDVDKFCLRIRQEGYHLAGCQDLFVHHFGSRLISA
jgi:GT2 family glycosyltransferase